MNNHTNTIRSSVLVAFYRFWHGRLHLKGAGLLLRKCIRIIPELQRFKLEIPNVGWLTVNLQDTSGMEWLNYSMGETGQEEGLIVAIKSRTRENAVVWDIGANAGFFGAALAKHLAGYSEIRLFEPNSQLIPCLHELAECLPNIHVHNLAFSDTQGSLTLHIPKNNTTMTSLRPVPGGISFNVKCTTGDHFLVESVAPDPDVVVIDTEGNDCNVIRGLKNLIDRKRPVIFFENIFVSEEMIQSVIPDGYSHFTVDDTTGELLQGVQKGRGHNSILVPKPISQV